MRLYIIFLLCSYAVVHVEMKNEGEDAFKPEIYGDTIIIERRISESTSSTVLKDHQGFQKLLYVSFPPPPSLPIYVYSNILLLPKALILIGG